LVRHNHQARQQHSAHFCEAITDAKRVNVDFPAWMVDSLDREARRLGVTRQSLIKLWLADKLGQPGR
jgi:hypothetical protein